MKHILPFLFCSALALPTLQAQTSPNGKVQVTFHDGALTVSCLHAGQRQQVMSLPVALSTDKALTTEAGEVKYDMLTGKRSHCSNAYTQCTYQLTDGHTLQVRAYNDGVTWTSNNTSSPGLQQDRPHLVDFTSAQNDWLMHWADSYEGFFPKNSNHKEGEHLGYPALFEYKDGLFALLTESNVDSLDAASSFFRSAREGIFEVKADGEGGHADQTLILGSLAEVVASTLVTDNSQPCRLEETAWIEPGVASWVYWAYNHGSKDYIIIKKYTDMAVALNLPYVLIDAEWDEAAPMEYKGEKMPMVEAAVRYAIDHGVKPMIWYNSSVGWVNGAPGPKFRLNKPEDREREFAWCEKIGVAGVKIDFFSGDNNRNMRYMIELLECAAKHHLLVNFHGATIPRGWQRTYPNLVSTEGVYGAEWYNNVPTFTKRAAAHNATLPFTRNVVGPMDYTPCAFTDSQHPHITTHAHELALTVLFESGIQHLADRPESFLSQPEAVKNFLSELPTAWDETRLLEGYPGQNVVIARRKGERWFIAGINGTDGEMTFDLPKYLKMLSIKKKQLTVFLDGKSAKSPWEFRSSGKKGKLSPVTVPARGGFVIAE